MKPKLFYIVLPVSFYLLAISGLTGPDTTTEPIVFVKGQEKNTISATLLHVAAQLDLESDQQDLHSWNIDSFNAVLVPKKKDPHQVKNRGPVFSEELKTMLLKAERGDKMYFDKIRLINTHSDTIETAIVLNIR